MEVESHNCGNCAFCKITDALNNYQDGGTLETKDVMDFFVHTAVIVNREILGITADDATDYDELFRFQMSNPNFLAGFLMGAVIMRDTIGFPSFITKLPEGVIDVVMVTFESLHEIQRGHYGEIRSNGGIHSNEDSDNNGSKRTARKEPG